MANNTATKNPEQSLLCPAPSPLLRLARLFRCSNSHHVEMLPHRAVLDPQTKKVRIPKKDYATRYTPVTMAHWRRHIDGKCGLSFAPHLEDGTAVWGCIDFDDYHADLAALVAKIEARGILALVCRSKSGGGHVFIFFDAPISIEEAEALVRAIAGQLDLSDREIFPRVTEPGLNPFCINMPYLGTPDSSPIHHQVGLKARGEMTLSEFVRVAERNRMNAEDRIALTAEPSRNSRPAKPEAHTAQHHLSLRQPVRPRAAMACQLP